MSKQLLLVLSSPPPGVPAVEYFEWYEAHLDELLEVRGFVGAQRFLVQELGSVESPEGLSHLAIYEVEDPKRPWRGRPIDPYPLWR